MTLELTVVLILCGFTLTVLPLMLRWLRVPAKVRLDQEMDKMIDAEERRAWEVEDLARPFQVAHAPERLPARVAPFNGETRCYSVFGYEPSTLTKLHCCSSSAMALATLWSLTWPSQSMKKKYSHALRLLGRDSIFVMFNR